MPISRSIAAAAALLLTCSLGSHARAATVTVAVAANFTEPARDIAAEFKRTTGNEVVLSFGASGQLYTQVTQGAPFEILLSADTERPKKAIDEGFGVADTAFTYAVGKLVLWSKAPDVVKDGDSLKSGAFEKLSIANPATAPYGAAAIETLKALGLYDALAPKIVQGNSIGQAFQFVESGNAELGFVALSQLAGQAGSRWIVPEALHTPIRQDAVLLKKGAADEAAIAFLAFLKGPEAKIVIEKYGYAFGPRT